MVQLKILSGKQAGNLCVARRFPFHVGRSSAADLSLSDDGIWDEHLEINLDNSRAFVLSAKSDGLVSINGQSTRQTPLRNGDIIEIGSAKLQFWLSEVGQFGLRASEWFVWALVTIISLSQIAVIYWLLD